MKPVSQIASVRPNARQAFTLFEAVIALAIAGVAMAALASGFVFLFRSSESSAYAVAANALALQGYERVRGASWDAMSFPNVDEVVSANFPPRGAVLDVGGSGTNLLYATNYTTITTVSTNPWLKAVRVDCVYSITGSRRYTNSIFGYRATETGQQNYQQSAPPAAVALPPPSGTSSATNSRVAATNANNNPGTVYTAPPPNYGSTNNNNNNNNNNNYYSSRRRRYR